MTFALPTWPGHVSADPFIINRNAEPEPILNGEAQRFLRTGSKMGLKVVMPPMEFEDARLWIAALMRAERELATYEWNQAGFTPQNVGATVVGDPSSANATVVSVAGLTGGSVILGGQWFNHTTAGVKRLYNVSQTGNTPLIIAPPTRTPFLAGEALDFVTPVIEGWVKSGLEYSVNVAQHYGFEFTISEAR